MNKKSLKALFTNTKWLIDRAKGFSHYIIIIIIVGAISSVLGIYRALTTKWLVDAAITADLSLIYRYLFILGSILLIEVLIKAVSEVVTSRGSVMVSNSIQNKFYAKIIKTKWMDYLKYHSGDYLTRMTSDVGTITNVIITIVPSMISLVILVVGSFISILYMDSFFACLIIIVVPAAFVFLRIFSVKLKRLYLKSQAVESKYRSFLNESVQNMLLIKTFCLEQMNISRIQKIQKERFDLVLSRTKLSVITSSMMTISSWMGFFLVFLWGAVKIANGVATFGTLTALMQLIGNIQGPLLAMASAIPQIIYALASTERLREIESLKHDDEGMTSSDMKSAGVVFEGVNFSYVEGTQVLNNISFNIKPGETVALIGPSGEGKTTLIHLILSLLTPTNGHIHIYDETRNIEVNSNSRGSISYVPQGNNIFSGTIADNLRFGKADATDEELNEIAHKACAWEFINASENGLNTHIAERGIGLSEGQAQRIAIARALLHKAPVLLLDEATSALDSKTELNVLKTIKSLEPAPTCIIITHRPSALEICDRILQIENGVLRELEVADVMKG